MGTKNAKNTLCPALGEHVPFRGKSSSSHSEHRPHSGHAGTRDCHNAGLLISGPPAVSTTHVPLAMGVLQ